MWRSPKLLGIGVAVLAFLAFAFLLGFGLTAPGRERGQVRDVVEALARGDGDGALERLPVCRAEPACASGIRRQASELRGPGRVEILRYDPSVQLALSERLGTARVVWRVGQRLPYVQCVRVRRSGPLQGATVRLIGLSRPLADREGSCPGR